MRESDTIITYEVMESRLTDVKQFDEDLITQEIEEIISEFKLIISMKTTLSTMKGSYHYHLKSGKLKGLLEVTYWPKQKRLWVDIHENRRAEWNETTIKPFTERLAQQFGGIVVNKSDV
jgi:hypothetical protein